jgi:hypothetical protein
MTAMNWLATQLAWEKRLVELRGDGPAKLSVLSRPEAAILSEPEAREAA